MSRFATFKLKSGPSFAVDASQVIGVEQLPDDKHCVLHTLEEIVTTEDSSTDTGEAIVVVVGVLQHVVKALDDADGF